MPSAAPAGLRRTSQPTGLPSRAALRSAREIVRAQVPPTPTHRWALLERRLGAQVHVKHENHTALGAFKLRGGAVYLHELVRREPAVRGVIAATRGNHGQSVARAAALQGLSATIVVPHGNSVEKNAAMRALGATLIEHGEDFQQAREHAHSLADGLGLHRVPSFHADLVRGVASYWIEFFEVVQPDVVLVPIGQGSGIVACAAARAYAGVSTRIVGVVSAHATAYLDSLRAGRSIEAPVSTVLADGMACRVPDADALAIMQRELHDIVAVSDDEVAEAMRIYFSDTHNVAEGAGAAPLAAALQRREAYAGQCIGLALTGGNVDRKLFARVLAKG
jgi:threonine dehydratase